MLSSDNCGLSFLTYDEDLQCYVSQSWAFLPNDNVREKERLEKVPYRVFEKNGWCKIVGDRIVDYGYLEDFILNFIHENNLTVIAILYDKYNANSTVSKFNNLGLETIEVPQGFYTLSPSCALFKKMVYTGQFRYVKNKLFEINVGNAREISNAQGLVMIAKKVSTGKIDMLASLLNCFTVCEEKEVSVYEERELIFL